MPSLALEQADDRIAELEQRLAELEKLDELKTQFVTLASHELRTPISVVHGMRRHSTTAETSSAPSSSPTFVRRSTSTAVGSRT